MHRLTIVLVALYACAPSAPPPPRSGPPEVVATAPDVASLTRAVGGTRVTVHCLVAGPGSPETHEVTPSDLAHLSRAGLLVRIGQGIEDGWLPAALQSAANARLTPGQPGWLDLGERVKGVAEEGHAHAHGHSHHPSGVNPHYLLDPLEGLRAAAEIRDRLIQLDPAGTDDYRAHYTAFGNRLLGALLGPDLARQLTIEAVLAAYAADGLDALLSAEGRAPLGGWLGEARQRGRVPVAVDHDAYPYFARRFGLEVVGTFEPEAGGTPTPGQLAATREAIAQRGVRVILTSAFFDPRYGTELASATGARLVDMAHQPGAREGVGEDYLSVFVHNLAGLRAALVERPR